MTLYQLDRDQIAAATPDRDASIIVITRGAAADGSQDTFKVVTLSGLLSLVRAADLDATPAENGALIYDGNTLGIALIQADNLDGDIVDRLAPTPSQANQGQVVGVNSAGQICATSLAVGYNGYRGRGRVGYRNRV